MINRQLFTSKRASIRRAMFTLCKVIVTRFPALTTHHLATISPLVLSSLEEKDVANHGVLWDVYLHFSRSCPQSWKAVPNLKKSVFPRLFGAISK
jgi:hypothetical protein